MSGGGASGNAVFGEDGGNSEQGGRRVTKGRSNLVIFSPNPMLTLPTAKCCSLLEANVYTLIQYNKTNKILRYYSISMHYSLCTWCAAAGLPKRNKKNTKIKMYVFEYISVKIVRTRKQCNYRQERDRSQGRSEDARRAKGLKSVDDKDSKILRMMQDCND